MSTALAAAPIEASESSDPLLPTPEICRRVHKRTGIHWSTKAVNRFGFDGVSSRVPGGGKIYLRLERIGGRFYARWSWVEEFLAACDARPQTAPSVVSPAARDRETPSALLSLERKGHRHRTK
jgi:hypothetical protein